MLFSNDFGTTTVENNFALPYICDYIIDVLINFTNYRKDGTLNLRIYLDTVFIKIVDIWGFIISYLPVLEALFNNYNKLNKIEIKLFETLKNIFIKYLFTPRIIPIKINDLTNDLIGLNKIIKLKGIILINKKTPSLKISSSKRSKGITGQTYLLNTSQKIKSKSKTKTFKKI